LELHRGQPDVNFLYNVRHIIIIKFEAFPSQKKQLEHRQHHHHHPIRPRQQQEEYQQGQKKRQGSQEVC
jgi:hypothetical protein